MSRVLILMPTRTYRAEPFLRAAGRLGVEVTVATEREQVLAALTPGSTLALDFRRPRRAVRQAMKFAESYPIDAVVGVDDDVTVLAAGIAEALGISHNSIDSVKAARYKDVMRLVLAESELNSPDYAVFEATDDPRVVAGTIPFPCVLKPLALSASRGVIRADDAQSFELAFREILAILEESDIPADDPAAHQVLVEEFIPGREFALEGLLMNGTLTVLALFDKPDPLDGPYFEETIYVTPSRQPSDVQRAITASVERAAAVLRLREGPIHAEARWNERGAWVVEVAPRSIGGLCSRMLRFELDPEQSWEEIILRQATRQGLASLVREQRPAGVMMIPIPAEGILCGVSGLEAARSVAGIEDVTISIPIGRPVISLPRGAQYLGFIFARCDSAEEVEAALRGAHGLLRFDIRANAAESDYGESGPPTQPLPAV